MTLAYSVGPLPDLFKDAGYLPDPHAPEQRLLWIIVAAVLLAVVAVRFMRRSATRTCR